MISRSPLKIFVKWTPPADTGVGGVTRPLLSYTLQRNFGDNTFPALTTVNVTVGNTVTSYLFTASSASATLYYFRVFTTNDAGTFYS